MVRIAGFAFVTVAFAVVQPLVLVGLPLALLLATYGPRGFSAAAVVAAAVVLAFSGDRSGIWWFERGWSLVLAGTFVWVVGWRPGWGFSAQALSALAFATAIVAAVLLAGPTVWQDLNALMTVRAAEAVQAAAGLLGDVANDTVQSVLSRVVSFQVLVFPALLGVSSLGALGVAIGVRSWLAGNPSPSFSELRSFRFNDHLVWVWVIGLGLLLAPIGEVADRIGSNAVLFMGFLYIVRGFAVVLSLVGGISLAAGIVGGVIALLLYPILALLLAAMLIVGLSDTWLNVRGRAGKS
jgi:hypothetical protein